jgi:Ca2+-binding EF-hand superfamily protein
MPPKRKRPAPQPSASTSAAPKPSRLAKAHHITAAQETLIREAFSLYQIPSGSDESDSDSAASLKTKDVRACLTALGVRIPRAEWAEVLETLDPEDEGSVAFEAFFAFAALHLARGRGEDESGAEDDEEVRAAFALFTGGKGSAITLAHLRSVAKIVREDVDDDVLKMMISEANGGDWRKGVGKGDFEDVMRRAGAIS